MNDYFNYYTAWDKILKERRDIDLLVICYEDLKKVNGETVLMMTYDSDEK